MLIPQKVNDFEVVAAIKLPERSGFLPGYVVLCERDSTHHDKWVVWDVIEDGVFNAAYYGHYTNDYDNALKDLFKRAGLTPQQRKDLAEGR